MYYFTDELYHHGVKGQKWGIRKSYKNYKNISSFRKKNNINIIGLKDIQ